MAYNRLSRVDVCSEPAGKLTAAALGDQLKGYFDAITCGPVPDRLLKLTEALDQAFERGELRCCDRRAPSRSR